MAIDYTLMGQIQAPSIFSAAAAGEANANQNMMAPLQRQAMQANTAQVQAETGKLDMAKQIAGAGYMAGAIKQLQQLPQEQRWPTAQLHLAKMQAMGLDTTGVDESHMSDEGLQQAYGVVAPIAQMAQQGRAQGYQSVGTPLVGIKDGRVVQIGLTFDPATNEFTSKEIPKSLTGTG